MSDFSGSWRDFASCVPKDPPEVTSRFRLVAVISRQNFECEKKALNQAEELMPQRISASQEESNHRIVDRYNQGCVRFTSKIVIGKEVGEKGPILENWINRSAEKTGLTANLAYCTPIDRCVPADYERFGVHRKYSTPGYSCFRGVRGFSSNHPTQSARCGSRHHKSCFCPLSISNLCNQIPGCIAIEVHFRR